MELELTVDRKEAIAEVAVATAYAAAKSEGGASALERMATVDEDEDELLRFWDEARADLCLAFGGMVESEGMEGDTYRIRLDVSDLFDAGLEPGMEPELRGYFVHGVLARWYGHCNKAEAAESAAKAASRLDSLVRKAVLRRRPERPSYGG